MTEPTSALFEQRYKDPQFLHDWSCEVLAFLRALAAQGGERTDPFDEMVRITGEQFAKRSLRGLRSIFHDVREWASGLNKDERERLSQVLHRRFGADAAYFKGRV